MQLNVWKFFDFKRIKVQMPEKFKGVNFFSIIAQKMFKNRRLPVNAAVFCI